MLTIAKTVAHGSFGFNTEIVVRTLVFVKKIHIGHTISVAKPNGAATISIRNRRVRCLGLIAN